TPGRAASGGGAGCGRRERVLPLDVAPVHRRRTPRAAVDARRIARAGQELRVDAALTRAVAGRGGEDHHRRALAQVGDVPDPAAVGPGAADLDRSAAVLPAAPAEGILAGFGGLDALAA